MTCQQTHSAKFRNISRHELLLQHVVIPARQIPPLLLLHNVEEKIDYSGASLKPGVCHKDAKRHLLHLHKTHWDVTKQYLVSDQIRLYRHVYWFCKVVFLLWEKHCVISSFRNYWEGAFLFSSQSDSNLHPSLPGMFLWPPGDHCLAFSFFFFTYAVGKSAFHRAHISI